MATEEEKEYNRTVGQQDDLLDKIGDRLGAVKGKAKIIGEKLDEHNNELLPRFENGVDEATKRADVDIDKMEELVRQMKRKDQCKYGIVAFLTLGCILCFLIIIYG